MNKNTSNKLTQPKVEEILLVKVGNDIYPTTSEAYLHEIENVVRRALKTGILVTNHTVSLQFIPIPADFKCSNVRVTGPSKKKSAGLKKHTKSPKINRKEFLKP